MSRQFQSLDSFLIANQAFWRFEPFFASQQLDLPWCDSEPQLCAWLNALSENEINAFKQDNAKLLEAMSAYFPQLSQISQWVSSLPQLKCEGFALDRGVETGVPGRKLEQILSMGEAALTAHNGSEWLEWCSGKGFLGRILASQSSQPVTSFEYQQALCDSGQAEADKQQLPMTFVQGDALSERSLEVFNERQHAVALHACGDLHVSLLTKGVDKQLPAMTISPCCYHLIEAEIYQPLSKLAQLSQLALTKSELRIPLQETVTGGERVRRHRMQEMTYRLGFDALLRECLSIEQYQPVPSIKKSLLSDGFEAFCQWACERKGIELPKVDFERFEAKGMSRYWQMERISLVQQPYRRVLELWLAFDKVLYLEDNGYEVELSEFCPRETTPRNLLIHAKKAN